MSSAVLDSTNYAFLQDYLERVSGLALGEDKEYFLEARLLPIAQAQSLSTLNDLCALLRSLETPDLKRKVVNAVTTNETFFFREPALFEALRHKVLPELMAGQFRPLRVWSAAASSGQEAFSFIMMCREMGLQPLPEVLATDLSTEILNRAKSGTFRQIEVNRGLPAPLLLKYFTSHGREWRVNETVSAPVRFELFDLRERMERLGTFDLIFCRNVLIYFDRKTRADVIQRLMARLAPGGYLALGGTESIMSTDFDTAGFEFERHIFGDAAFYRPIQRI